MITALVVSWFFRYYLFEKRPKFFQRYAFVTGAAFDGGVGFAIISFFALKATNNDFKLYNPLTPDQTQVKLDYYCFADATFSHKGNHTL